MDGHELVLSGDYPRLALSVLSDEGFPAMKVCRELQIPDEVHSAAMANVLWHYKIIEYGRGNVPAFRVKMAARCGINTLGPLIPVVLAAGCVREAWLALAIYIPLIDKTVKARPLEASSGVAIEVIHESVSIENRLDFAYATHAILSSVAAAGLNSIDIEVHGRYYNMGEAIDKPKWGQHSFLSDSGAARATFWVSAEIGDKKWPQHNQNRMRDELKYLEGQLALTASKPGIKVKLEKALASCEVRRGKALPSPEESAEYLRMTIPAINKRLKKHDTTLQKIWLSYAVRHAEVLADETDKSWEEINDLTLRHEHMQSFGRAMKRATGKTLTEIRNAV